MKARCKELEDKQKQAESRIEELKSENSGLKEHRDELQVQIQELENRPVEVMQSTAELEEIERLKARMNPLQNRKQNWNSKSGTMKIRNRLFPMPRKNALQNSLLI